MSSASSESLSSLFLALAVATSLAITGMGYLSGSAPEPTVLKASIGLLTVGLIGVVVSASVRLKADDQATVAEAKGTNVDVVLAETESVEAGVNDKDITDSPGR